MRLGCGGGRGCEGEEEQAENAKTKEKRGGEGAESWKSVAIAGGAAKRLRSKETSVTMTSALGDDGDGYELAVQLENSAIWKEWLGAASYAMLLPHLSSPAAWHSFMDSSPPHLPLQMSVRALLFDRLASCCLPTNDNNAYLQLDANGVYFSLDQDAEDWTRLQAEGSPVISSLLVKHGLGPPNGSTGNGEDVQGSKGASVSTQQRPNPHTGQQFSNMISPKQEVSRPSLTKVKKVEAWDNFDAKRPMEMVGTINKKLRSPKIFSKPSFQGDPTLSLASRDHPPDKMSITKSPPGCLPILEEPKNSALGSKRVGRTEGVYGTKLWYDRCFEKRITLRMDQVAQRSAQQKLPFKEQDACLRTAEGMAAYLGQCSKRIGKVSIANSNADSNPSVANYSSGRFSVEETSKSTDDALWVPEFRFLGNSVPDNSVPAKRRKLNKYQIESRGLLDNLESLLANSNPGVSYERPVSQMDPDTLFKDTVDPTLPGSSKSARCFKPLQEEYANQIMQQTVAKLVRGAGFDGLKQSSMDLLCDLLAQQLKRLGSRLRLFVDNYRKRCSQVELLKMFMQSTGNGIEALIEHELAGWETGSQVGTPPGQQVSRQASNQKEWGTPTPLPTQQLSPPPPPSPLGPSQQARQALPDKALKRRHLSNLGRAKRVEKDVKSGGEARSDVTCAVRDGKLMQISPRLHTQQSSWHPQTPLAHTPPGTVLQNIKPQLSSLQQLSSLKHL